VCKKGTLALVPKSLVHRETIESKRAHGHEFFDWDWNRVGAELGVCGRTAFRQAHRKTRVSKKAKKRIEFLYWNVLLPAKRDASPLRFSHPNGVWFSSVFSDLEKAGLANEIKRRFLELEPDLKPLKDKTLAGFFFERARVKIQPSVSKIMELNTGKPAKLLGKTNRYKSVVNGGVSSVSMKVRNEDYDKNARLIKTPRKQLPANNRGKKGSRGGGNKTPSSGDDESGEGDDADSWLLKSVAKNRNIYLKVELLFENLKLRARETGKEIDLLNGEVEMSIYTRKGSRYFYINISFNGDRFRTTSRCESRREAEKIKTLLLAKLINSLPVPGTEEKKVPLFKDASEKFVGYQRGKNLASWKRDELSHRQVCLYLGNRPVNQIKSPDIQLMMTKEGERVVKGGKKIDVVFEPGETYHFGVSVFDNAEAMEHSFSDVLTLVFR